MTANTQRRIPGAHTVWRPLARPATTASATTSGVVEKGWASMPSVMRVWTNPGRTTSTLAPVSTSESPSPWAKASRPALDEP